MIYSDNKNVLVYRKIFFDFYSIYDKMLTKY